jgi:hypothetical protein
MQDSRYRALLEIWGSRGLAKAASRQWARIARILQCSTDEAREFGQRLLKERFPDSAPPKSLPDPDSPKQDHKYAHDASYWHDSERGVYVIWLPHLPKPLALPTDMWAGIKAAYSSWDGQPASVEQIARKFGLTRRTVTALMRVMGHTHTGSPWTREQVMVSEDKTLVEDLILAREEGVLRQAEAQRWNTVKSKAEAFERLQRGCLDALNEWLNTPKQRLAVSTTIVRGQPAETLAVLGLTDLHYGAQNHDAAAALDKVLAEVFRRWEQRGAPSLIVLPIGSDGMHYDTAGYTTTSGTRMEAEGPAREVIVGYMDMIAKLILSLSAVASVHCVPMAGNHDRMMSYATFAAMRLAFKGNDTVQFSESLSEIQVFTHGKSFIALHHGDRHKPAALAGILPRDYAEQWGATQYRYCLLGHYHTPGTFGTKSGLECLYMPSLSPTDEWTESMGFRSQPALSVYAFDAVDGLVTVDTIR